MTKLEKYLLSMAREVIDAETTNSRYFLIGEVKIRLSDHTSKNNDSDIQIIIPYNGGTIYTVIIEGAQRLLSWNAKQIIEFLPSMVLIKALKAPVQKSEPRIVSVAEKIELTKGTPELEFKTRITSKLKQNKLGSAQRAVLLRSKTQWNADEIKQLPLMFHQEFNRGDCINDDFQIFLMCTALTYEEVINIYKMVVIDAGLKPTVPTLTKAYDLLTKDPE